MNRLLRSPSGLFIIAALSVAMTVSGFAHRHHSLESKTDLLAYMQAGGSSADICGDANGAHGFAETCDACRLAGSALVPGAGAAYVSLPPANPRWSVLAQSVPFVSSPRDLSRPVRAPPAV